MTRGDIDLDSRRIRVLHAKTKRTRFVRLRRPAEEALDAVPAVLKDGLAVAYVFVDARTGKPYTESAIDFAFRSTVARAGLKDLHFHDLRHDLATNLYRETHDLQAVQKVLGHSVVTTSARYAHVVQTDVDAAMDALDKPRNVGKTSELKALAEAN